MKTILALALTLLPTVASAQEPLRDINSVASKAISIGTLFVTLLITFAVIWIIWGIVKYIIAGGEEERAAGRMNVVWGVVGLFLIFSIWGLVNILRNSFSTNTNTDLQNDIPKIVPQSFPPVR